MSRPEQQQPAPQLDGRNPRVWLSEHRQPAQGQCHYLEAGR
jgi:hypothetical protein